MTKRVWLRRAATSAAMALAIAGVGVTSAEANSGPFSPDAAVLNAAADSDAKVPFSADVTSGPQFGIQHNGRVDFRANGCGYRGWSEHSDVSETA